MTVGEKLSQVTLSEIEEAGKDCLNGKETKNKVLSKLFSSIKGHCKTIGHSNEAAMAARQKLFSLWHLFGCPAIFFTVTPCDECSFRVRLYATCSKHSIPTFNDLTKKEYCVLDLKLRKDARRCSPGACALEYELSLIHI